MATDESLRYAETYLETCAMGWTAIDRPDWTRVLYEAAVRYVAARGDLAAAERAELTSLRQVRDGIVGLRAELAADRTDDGRPMTSALAIETIDAILKMASMEAP